MGLLLLAGIVVLGITVLKILNNYRRITTTRNAVANQNDNDHNNEERSGYQRRIVEINNIISISARDCVLNGGAINANFTDSVYLFKNLENTYNPKFTQSMTIRGKLNNGRSIFIKAFPRCFETPTAVPNALFTSGNVENNEIENDNLRVLPTINEDRTNHECPENNSNLCVLSKINEDRTNHECPENNNNLCVLPKINEDRTNQECSDENNNALVLSEINVNIPNAEFLEFINGPTRPSDGESTWNTDIIDSLPQKSVDSTAYSNKMYSCERCKTNYQNKSSFYRHQRNCQSEQIKESFCDVCNMLFVTKEVFECHMIMFHNFQCPHCPNQYSRRESYEHHLQMHAENIEMVESKMKDESNCAIENDDIKLHEQSIPVSADEQRLPQINVDVNRHQTSDTTIAIMNENTEINDPSAMNCVAALQERRRRRRRQTKEETHIGVAESTHFNTERMDTTTCSAVAAVNETTRTMDVDTTNTSHNVYYDAIDASFDQVPILFEFLKEENSQRSGTYQSAADETAVLSSESQGPQGEKVVEESGSARSSPHCALQVVDPPVNDDNNLQRSRMDADEERRLKFGCDKCDKRFMDEFLLFKHEEWFHSTKEKSSNRCADCLLGFANKYDLQAHKLRHAYECPRCQEKFPCHKELLALHVKDVHRGDDTNPTAVADGDSAVVKDGRPVAVDMAEEKKAAEVESSATAAPPPKRRRKRRTTTTSVDSEEGKKKTAKRSFKCDKCVMEFKSNVSLIRHSRVHKIIEKVKSPKADDGASSSSSPSTTSMSSSNLAADRKVKTLKCNQCDKTFIKKQFLKLHKCVCHP